MATRVCSFSKINLGLAIGPTRPDGYHGLTTLYQTLALHDVVSVTAKPAPTTRLELTTNHRHVPTDGRNTAWKMVERCLVKLGVTAEVAIHIEKNLPVQGGMGAGSANAAAALLGLERELGIALDEAERLAVAAEVGSDVPLFLIGGAVLGVGRGEIVTPMSDLAAIPCVIAIPEIGVSTPAAFRDWDALAVRPQPGTLTGTKKGDRLEELSLAYSAWSTKASMVESDTSGIAQHDLPQLASSRDLGKKQGSSDLNQDGILSNLAENALLALVRTGIGTDLQNNFEAVVFPQYPSLRETKRHLMGNDSGSPALYAALSGSGSALFGLYRSIADARAAQQRVQASGVRALLTSTLPRTEYWRRMFAG